MQALEARKVGGLPIAQDAGKAPRGFGPMPHFEAIFGAHAARMLQLVRLCDAAAVGFDDRDAADAAEVQIRILIARACYACADGFHSASCALIVSARMSLSHV